MSGLWVLQFQELELHHCVDKGDTAIMFWVAIITALATIVLTRVTYLYLKETQKMRTIAYETLSVDASPKVFIKTINTFQEFDEQVERINIRETIEMANVGKTEAKNIKVSYKILLGGIIQVPWELTQAPHIFPSQRVFFDIIPVGVSLTDQETAQVKKNVQEKKLSLFMPFTKPKIEIQINIDFLGYKDMPQCVSYSCVYRWDANNWALNILQVDKAVCN